MPKPYTLPTLYNELKTVSISFLSKHGYLKPNRWQSGTITWSRNGTVTGSISIAINSSPHNTYLVLSYSSNGQPIKYNVQLIPKPSNLGKGFVWFFICPFTNKKCRKLYLSGGYFKHRQAISGMYEKQTQSKKMRFYEKHLGEYFDYDETYTAITQKHLKKKYAGKPTKKYSKLLQKIRKAERVTASDIERAILGL